MSEESELLKKEIIEQYHCYSGYGDGCGGDCDFCKKWLSDDLDVFEKKVRSDAIDECIEALGNNFWDISKLEQLKEQKE